MVGELACLLKQPSSISGRGPPIKVRGVFFGQGIKERKGNRWKGHIGWVGRGEIRSALPSSQGKKYWLTPKKVFAS